MSIAETFENKSIRSQQNKLYMAKELTKYQMAFLKTSEKTSVI